MSSTEMLRGTCAQEECKFSENGQCMEGFPNVAECPHFIREARVEAESVSGEPASAQDAPIEKLVPIHPGEALTSDDARVVTRDSASLLIMLAGESNSGKTTLINAVYDRFLRGPFAGHRFCGSRTLLGFERRCFPSRTASGREEGTTDHTQAGEGRSFLHLRLRDDEIGVQRDILIADLAGEWFERIRNDAARHVETPALKRADHFAAILDGELLLEPAERALQRVNTRMLIRGLVEKHVLSHVRGVQLVITKWDKVVAAQEEPVARDIAEALAEAATSWGVVASVHQTSARTETPKQVPWGFGVEELLRAWLRTRTPMARTPDSELPSDSRWFDRFLPSGMVDWH